MQILILHKDTDVCIKLLKGLKFIPVYNVPVLFWHCQKYFHNDAIMRPHFRRSPCFL